MSSRYTPASSSEDATNEVSILVSAVIEKVGPLPEWLELLLTQPSYEAIVYCCNAGPIVGIPDEVGLQLLASHAEAWLAKRGRWIHSDGEDIWVEWWGSGNNPAIKTLSESRTLEYNGNDPTSRALAVLKCVLEVE